MLAALELFEFTSRRREQWYGGKLVPARNDSPWVEPDETGMYSNIVFDTEPKEYPRLNKLMQEPDILFE